MNVDTNLRTWISVTRSVSGTGTDFEDQRPLVGTCGHCLFCFILFIYLLSISVFCVIMILNIWKNKYPDDL